MKQTDLLIIGGGPGGYVAAIYGARCGKKVTLVEKERLGGTCLNIGCIPTKTLVKSSEVFAEIKKASEFGIVLNEEPQVDMNAVMDRKEKVVDRLVGGIEHLMEKNGIEVICGTASFIDDKTIRVEGEETLELTYNDLILATGSKVASVPIPGVDNENVWNSNVALAARELPKSITIIGGGVIGLEFAFMYRHFGCQVTVVEFLDRLMAVLDSDVSAEILRQAKKAGIKVHTSSRVTEITEGEDGMTVHFERKEKMNEVTSEKVLVAIGRSARIDGLGLENTKIELLPKNKGIKVDEYMQTSVPHIYAIGDVNNVIQLAHAASHQGFVAVDHIVGCEDDFKRDLVPSVIFTSPEVATVGITEDRLKEMGAPYKVGKVNFNGNGKAVTMGAANGFCKLIKNDKGEIVGGAVVGPDASTLISAITVAVRNKLHDVDLTNTIFPHPTTGEVIHEAALDLNIGSIHQ
ncbi:MAG: dihydrolipoyl dehydrogenase [Lachnospiraceae bacterium]|nr:dihydrolipoyl dehydrogenase [Lachnospiraceae bacterium]